MNFLIGSFPLSLLVSKNETLYHKLYPMKKLIFVLTVGALFACKKEETNTLTEELAKNSWQKTSILISADSIAPDTIPTIDVLSAKPTCAKDNIWSFNAESNTFTLDEGAEKCNPAEPQIKDQGIIEEQNNGTSLKVEGGGTNEIWEIESRSASSFRVSYFGRNAGKMTKFRVTFTRI